MSTVNRLLGIYPIHFFSIGTEMLRCAQHDMIGAAGEVGYVVAVLRCFAALSMTNYRFRSVQFVVALTLTEVDIAA